MKFEPQPCMVVSKIDVELAHPFTSPGEIIPKRGDYRPVALLISTIKMISKIVANHLLLLHCRAGVANEVYGFGFVWYLFRLIFFAAPLGFNNLQCSCGNRVCFSFFQYFEHKFLPRLARYQLLR